MRKNECSNVMPSENVDTLAINDSITILKCVFCGKTRAESNKMLISGDKAICDECILLFNGLIYNKKPAKTETPKPTKSLKLPQLDSIKIKKYLDKNVIGQESAKIALSVSVVNHYKRMMYETTNNTELDKSNLLISGPSGSGKSLLISTISKFLNVPFISVDATTLTEAGYIGENVDTIISRLLLAANGDVTTAEQGIIFLDEIDKLATNKESFSTSDNKVAGVQAALLKMVEGSVVRVPATGTSKKSFIPQLVEVNTKNILFIAGGAFTKLNKIVADRLKKKTSLGFTDVAITSSKLENEYITDDFIEFGLIPEFIGRFPLHTHTSELTTDELIKVLTELDNNILNQYKFYFEIDGVNVEFTEGFINKIAENSKKNKTGVRGLRSLCDSIMTEHLFLLPEYKKQNICKLTFDETCAIKNSIPKIEMLQTKTKKS
jgi:ATP-dependent Clp protease ATP-binding subunit ClpX